jgi:gamma-glutamyltranspeptidase / glutathione hydrolase
MVSAAHPLAVEAGLEILRRGGSAVDAAITVQLVLGFVEAPETGIGGGGFLLLRRADGGLELFDGRETAPAAATPDRFTVFGRPVPAGLAVPTGRAVGVPGLVAMLAHAHERHGRVAWAELFEPAIRLAESGVPMPERLRRESLADGSLRLFADTRQAFRAPARASGSELVNREYAGTLRTLAGHGADAFYQGEIAAALVERARARRPWPSDLEVDDLRAYTVIEREPLCGPYRRWTVCGPPPPSSGGLALLQILAMVERFPLAELEPGAAAAVHVLAEAHRLAFADREAYLGDPAFVAVPVEGLLDSGYLDARSALIDPSRALRRVLPGRPAGAPGGELAAPPRSRSGGTSHLTVADAEGNVVALTSSIEAPFGARMSSSGFLLNNQLTDFSFAPRFGDRPHPNAVAPGKRPRSSMTPVVVLDGDGEIVLALGSRGGPRITSYVLKVLIGTLDWELDIQDAIDLPNFAHAGDRLELEAGTTLAARRAELESLGHRVRVTELTSGLHGIARDGDGWRGGADLRLEGVARGE